MNFVADYGTITISDANGRKYDNAYTGTEKNENGHLYVAVAVREILSANDLSVLNNAVVYAQRVYAEVPTGTNGTLTVEKPENTRAYLYTSGAYGVRGEGTDTAPNGTGYDNDGDGQNVFGTKLVSIQYVLNPEGVIFTQDLNSINNPNRETLSSYVVDPQGEKKMVANASCTGYYFRGWYEDAEFTKGPVTQVDTSHADNLTFYAKWEKVAVTFEVRILIDEAGDVNDDRMELVSGNIYRFKQKETLLYGETILDILRIEDYITNTQGVVNLSWNGANVDGAAIVSKTMVTEFLAQDGADKALILLVTNTQDQSIRITLDMNLNASGKPLDTVFNESADPNVTHFGNTLYGYASIMGTMAIINGFVNDGSLIRPSAPGYTFGGWYTEKSCGQGTEVTIETPIIDLFNEGTTRLYAKWTPNVYLVKFDAGQGSWVTADDTAPTINAPEIKALHYHWTYDTGYRDGQFMLTESDSDMVMTQLPTAWREGYVFEGWEYETTDGQKILLADTKDLSKRIMAALDVNQPSNTVALVFNAQYHQAVVTHQLDGGKWTDSGTKNQQNLGYGTSLMGYTMSEEDTDDQDLFGTASDIYSGNAYSVISTTSAYFNRQQKFVENDYREDVYRKGYTFLGWYIIDQNGNVTDKTCGSAPRFEDLTVRAKWQANSYLLKLNGYDSTFANDYESDFNDVAKLGQETLVTVTVDQEINTDKWPARDGNDAWYAHNTSADTGQENARRYLLGFTFAPMDPGTAGLTAPSKYHDYADAVTNMQNSGTLYQRREVVGMESTRGTTFTIPEDISYNKDIVRATKTDVWRETVPDYPSGSTIQMYAVYRERSLVFVEYYVDSEGVHETVLYSCAWTDQSIYPTEIYPDDERGNYDTLTTTGGFRLIGWYANEPTIAVERLYSTNVSAATRDSWKQAATNTGVYDIKIYTVYLAQDSHNVTLTAQASATAVGNSSDQYALPGSMQTGSLSYQIADIGNLQLVSVEEMKKHQYDSSWTIGAHTYTADNTVAIELDIIDANGNTIAEDADLKSVGDKFTNVAGAGTKITLTLYHSRVMTKSREYAFTITFLFDNSTGVGVQNTLADQKLEEKVTVKLTPSLYKVVYRAEFPEQVSDLKVIDWNGYSVAADTADETEKELNSIAYGSTLPTAQGAPVIEGYRKNDVWTNGSETYTKLTVPVKASDNGEIYLSTGYTAETYLLKADSGTLDRWTITYTDGVDGAQPIVLPAAGAQVKYHSEVVFTAKTSGEPGEYITVNTGNKAERLSEITNKTFRMPAGDTLAAYSDVLTLYLEEGSIAIETDRYTQIKASGIVTRTWPGSYVILQNAENDAQAATENVLVLDGNLDGRQISLGNLNISATDSIKLEVGTTVGLTMDSSTVTAENILVPQGTALTLKSGMVGEQKHSSKLVLSPGTIHAAIGASADNPVNGIISVENLSVYLEMPMGSNASGIGSGKQDFTMSGCGTVAVTNCAIEIYKSASANDKYSGTWIGGDGVDQVFINNTTLVRSTREGGTMAGAQIVAGEVVSLDGVTFGTPVAELLDPIYAENTLTVKDSQLYLENNYPLKNQSMIGTGQNGVIKVHSSAILVAYGSNGSSDQLYTGTMKVMDAQSDVTIRSTQIMDVRNGNIIINVNGVNQDTAEHLHNGLEYLLLEDNGNVAVAGSLVVNGLSEGAKITVQQPADSTNTAVDVGNLTINTYTDLVVNGGLTIGGVALLAEDSMLNVIGEDGYVISFMGDQVDAFTLAANAGTYKQSGGSLSAAKDFGRVGVDVVLNNVTAEVKNLYSKNLTISGGSITADRENGKVGSVGLAEGVTTVTLSNGVVVTATIIGALGEQNETFTFVETDSDVAYTGTLMRDHYRLSYDVSNLINAGSVSGLHTVLRTATTNGVVTAIPEIPSALNAVAEPLFLCWYIGSADGTEKFALMSSGNVPSGLNGMTTLGVETASSDMGELAGDGTRTLVIHAWLKATGEITMKAGRLFAAFTDGDDQVTVPVNGAWTALLESTGGNVTGRDYRIAFANALPEGTDLTLTAIGNGVNTYYYYKCGAGVTSVKFSDFTKMGMDPAAIGAAPALAMIPSGNETFLLSADFGDATASVIAENGVTFGIIPAPTAEVVEMDSAAYSLTSVLQGELAGSDGRVEIKAIPGGDSALNGNTIFLIAKLSSSFAVNAPYGAMATLNGSISGKWISRDTVSFALGNYENLTVGNYGVAFSGLEAGSYEVAWTLCSSPDDSPVTCLNQPISNTCETDYTVAATVEPGLKITSDMSSQVLKQGETHELTFTYEATSTIVVAVEEQKDLLAGFNEVGGLSVTSDSENKVVKVTFPETLAEGTYRICFSLHESSKNDNVYVTFIVKDYEK